MRGECGDCQQQHRYALKLASFNIHQIHPSTRDTNQWKMWYLPHEMAPSALQFKMIESFLWAKQFIYWKKYSLSTCGWSHLSIEFLQDCSVFIVNDTWLQNFTLNLRASFIVSSLLFWLLSNSWFFFVNQFYLNASPSLKWSIDNFLFFSFSSTIYKSITIEIF